MRFKWDEAIDAAFLCRREKLGGLLRQKGHCDGVCPEVKAHEEAHDDEQQLTGAVTPRRCHDLRLMLMLMLLVHNEGAGWMAVMGVKSRASVLFLSVGTEMYSYDWRYSWTQIDTILLNKRIK